VELHNFTIPLTMSNLESIQVRLRVGSASKIVEMVELLCYILRFWVLCHNTCIN